MPTPPKQLDNSTKHRTKAETAVREAAEQSVTPQREKVKLRRPKLVSQDKAAAKYWRDILREVNTSGAELLDNLDSEVFAGYCSMLAMRDRLAVVTPKLIDLIETLEGQALDDPESDSEEAIKTAAKALRSCDALNKARMTLDNSILAYAEKLGLTPSGRSRLAVKRAQQEEDDDPMAALLKSACGGSSV